MISLSIDGYQPTSAEVQAQVGEERANMSAMSRAVEVIVASPEEFAQGLLYVADRSRTDFTYAMYTIDQLNRFETLPETEKAVVMSADQQQVFTERSNMTKAIIAATLQP